MAMGPDNAVVVDVATYVMTATSLTILVQGSSDGENWGFIDAPIIGTEVGAVIGAPVAITTTHFRLLYLMAGTGTCIIDVGANTCKVVHGAP